MRELQRRVEEKLDELEKIISERTVNNPSYNQLVEKVRSMKDRIAELKIPLLYSRVGFDRWVELYSKLNDLTWVLRKHDELTMEDIYSLIDEVEEAIDKYVLTCSRLYARENFLLYTPLYTALAIYLLNIFIDILNTGVETGFKSIVLNIGLIGVVVVALMFKKTHIDYSYILLAVSAAIGVFATPILSGVNNYTSYTLLVYMLVFATSITYLQTVRTVKSKTYKEKIESTMNNIIALTKELQKSRGGEDSLKIKELEEKALQIFKKLHGDLGEDLLRYKVNVMVMHGMRRDEALKKIISMYRDIIS